jgi:putative DNA primase/helicase
MSNVHNLFDPMFAPFTRAELDAAPVLPPEEELMPLIPVPSGAESMEFRHPTLGESSDEWAYFTSDGELIGYVLRFDYQVEAGGWHRKYMSICYCQSNRGSSWRAVGFPRPLPLFNLHKISQQGSAAILFCEGEKTASFAAHLFPEMVTTTSPYGSSSLKHVDWSPLVGRTVIVARDNDPAGEIYSDRVCELAYQAGAEAVMTLDIDKIGSWVWKDGQKVVRPDVPDGWDLADAYRDGWTAGLMATFANAENLYQIAPRPLVTGDHGRSVFRMSSVGVEKLVHRKERGVIVESFWKLVCSHLEVVAETRDADGRNWGKRFKLIDPDGSICFWHMPCEMLAGDGAVYREALQNLGLRIESHKADRDYLQEYLSTVTSTNRALSVQRVGWHGSIFITTQGAIGHKDELEPIVFVGHTRSKVGEVEGTMEGWQEFIAKPAVSNSKLIFALSAAFSGPLLLPTGSESGGFNFVGNSSMGKTTALHVAGSVWGGGKADGGYIGGWRATANGLEGLAADHCDCLLCLDDMGQVLPHEARSSAYLLANGIGKLRSNKNGDARKPAQWRIILLSTGEIGLGDKISEDTKGGPPAAGQLIRIIDIDADAGAGMGLFENLHGHGSPSDFARYLQNQSNRHYGHAGTVFVTKLTEDLEFAIEFVTDQIEEFVKKHSPIGKSDGQIPRVLRKFGLIAASGELATHYGVVPWPKGVAFAAVGKCFQGWLDERGNHSSLEEELALSRVRAIIEEHGSTRFAEIDALENFDGLLRPVRNRLGFIHKDAAGDTEYCFLPEMWNKEVCKGLNSKSIVRALRLGDFLVTGKDRTTKLVKVGKKPIRMYIVKEAIMLSSGEVGSEADSESKKMAFDPVESSNARLMESLKQKLSSMK